MKLSYDIYFIGVTIIFILYLADHGRSQDFYDSSLVFQNMTFDMVNRGSYNISFCVEEMLNCWEIVKADTICYEERYFSSVCSLMREFCSEFFHDQDNYYKMFYLKDSICHYYDQHFWT